MDDDLQPLASGKRLFLAGYLDYLMFGAPWAVAVWVLRRELPGFEAESLAVKLGFFVVLELLLFRILKWSPGQYLLGISAASESGFESRAPLGAPPTYVVDELLLVIERWWTVAIGVVIVLDGAKTMVRWTEFAPPAPWFGWVPEPPLAASLLVIFGLAEFAIGAAVLRLSSSWLAVGLLVYAVQLASTIASWSQLPAWAEGYVQARRAAQGLPVRAEALELARTLVPTLLALAPALALVAIGLVYRHARRVRVLL